MKPIEATVCFLYKPDENEILLAQKTRKIGIGRYNGYGGKREGDETFKNTTIREIRIETGGIIILPCDIREAAIAYFHNYKDNQKLSLWKVHVHVVEKWVGKEEETEEMVKPTWVNLDNLPFPFMMPADEYWIPIVFENKGKFIVDAYQDITNSVLLRPVEIKYVDSLV
ncbi:NUDIX domain-containing protein [Patescibacteria group bacterium]|nr:NUDIX domain-containing protein [Patescibacteria group bacterium]